MKKSELQQIIKEEIQNAFKAYGSQNISKLTPGSDEDIYLDDTSGELSGEVVSKKEYLERMLKKAADQKDWKLVGDAKLYSSIKLKDDKITGMLINAIKDKDWGKVTNTKNYLAAL
jgi:hypothetical protein